MGIRRDFHLACDAAGFCLASGDALRRIIDSDGYDGTPFVKAGELLMIQMIGDDYFYGRLVVDEPLAAVERDEWIARVRGVLRLEGGSLHVGAGFDQDVLEQTLGGDGDDAGHAFKVTPGKFQVDVYTHAPAMNARQLLPDTLGIAPGRWFRECYPDAPYPRWLASECRDLADSYDPEREDAWNDLAASVARGEIGVDEDPRGCIGFLIHLQPLAGPGDRTEASDAQGWHAPHTGLRKPATCPRGLPAVEVGADHYAGLLATREPRPSETPGREALDRVPLSDLGGAVDQPLDTAWRVARLGSFCRHYLEPELLIESAPSAAADLPEFDDVDRVDVDEGKVRLVFSVDEHAWRPETWEDELVPAFRELPEGTTLELGYRASDDDGWVQRFRGTLHGDTWKITHAYPAVSHETLREALVLIERTEGETVSVACADEAELKRIAAAAADHWESVPGSTHRQRLTLTASNQCDDGRILALEAFRERYREVWDVTQLEEQDRSMRGKAIT